MDDLKQPEALRLADALDKSVLAVCADAATELRRLHDVEQEANLYIAMQEKQIARLETASAEMLKTLNWLDNWLGEKPMPECVKRIRAAIAKHRGAA